jgi:hypothetical protein
LEQEDKFFADAFALTQDIIKPNASYGPISALLNVHAVFVPSNEVSSLVVPTRPVLMITVDRAV